MTRTRPHKFAHIVHRTPGGREDESRGLVGVPA
jgi:hypothetical protein